MRKIWHRKMRNSGQKTNTLHELDHECPFPGSAFLRFAQQPDPLGGLAEDVAVVAKNVDLVPLPVDFGRLPRLGVGLA